MYHILFCFVVTLVILLLITCIPKFRNISSKIRRIVSTIFFILMLFIKPDQYFIKFKSMDKAYLITL